MKTAKDRWVLFAFVMAGCFVVLASIGDGLALAAAIMFAVGLVKAAES